MIDFDKFTLVLLPHLDDEFAILPILRIFQKRRKNNITLLYFAESNIQKNYLRIFKRREENLKALGSIGLSKRNIVYLNDSFDIFDNQLHLSAKKIFHYLNKFINKGYKQIITLSLEGGHPDHDSLALITEKVSKINSINVFYFPAYNYENTFLIPYKVLVPIKQQKDDYEKLKLYKFCWLDSFKLIFVYKSQFKAFLKLAPFLLFNLLFSEYIYYTKNINFEKVNWLNSLTLKRYKIKISTILNSIDTI